MQQIAAVVASFDPTNHFTCSDPVRDYKRLVRDLLSGNITGSARLCQSDLRVKPNGQFPLHAVDSNNGEKPISDMTMTKLLRDDGIEGVTVHGFRSAFTDWAAERTRFPKEVADKALAHKLPNKVEAAYRRTDFFEKRRTLMARWAAFLDKAPGQSDVDTPTPSPLQPMHHAA